MSVVITMAPRPFSQTKGQLRELRLKGWIPAILCGQKKDPTGIQLCAKSFMKELEVPGIQTRVFDLGEYGPALISDIHFCPTRDVPQHIDFIRLGERAVVSVPVRCIHEDRCPGLKRGGNLNLIHYELKVSAPSHNIPSEILLDLSELEIGHTLHVKDVNLDEDVRILALGAHDGLVSVVAPSSADGEDKKA